MMRHSVSRALLGLASIFVLTVPYQSADATPAKDLRLEPWVVIGDDLRQPLVKLPEALQGHLVAENWEGVLRELSGKKSPEESSLAFLKAWALIQKGAPSPDGDLLKSLEICIIL